MGLSRSGPDFLLAWLCLLCLLTAGMILYIVRTRSVPFVRTTFSPHRILLTLKHLLVEVLY